MRNIIVFLVLAALASGAFDQSYVQTVASDGSSVIVKTQDLSVFSGVVSMPAVAQACEMMSSVQCSLDGQKMTITERFTPNSGYYTFVKEDGFPFITYTLVISQVPNDVFAADLDRVLAGANVSSGGAPSPPLDLSADNSESVAALRLLKVNLDYTVNMQMTPTAASAGNVTGVINGNVVKFNLVDVLAARQPIVIKSSELNAGAIVAIIGVAVLAWLAYSFFVSSRKSEETAPPLKRKKKK
ncbi:MAG: hypothetical protein PHV13_02230 [Candidatus ainarchaeum sp.]|nr:hypothetical protein [Candidatus ainarchaeum sp.]